MTAHKYLGLTREVIRTEKAINELACYPLPDAFWDSGGIARLRQRFVPETTLAPAEEKHDYFTLDTPHGGPQMGASFWGTEEQTQTDEGVKLKSRPPPRRGSTKKAGDLLAMSRDEGGDRHVDFDPLGTPRLERKATTARADDFDLRDAVMECISKAIGLVQHSTPAESVEASPMFRPQDQFLQKAVFNSSFGSLSFLGLQGSDDESSMTGSSVASFSSTELENEVEILYFAQDSLLVKEGEKNAGLYFVIEGFLDVSMPEDNVNTTIKSQSGPQTTNPSSGTSASASASASSGKGKPPPRRQGSYDYTNPRYPRRPTDHINSPASQTPFDPHQPPPLTPDGTPTPSRISLFTVKPGGIAGYLSSLSGFPSYVDIRAKTDCYVGFLPAKALERIMDRKPIVLLTLAKRLISLLSPLSASFPSCLLFPR